MRGRMNFNEMSMVVNRRHIKPSSSSMIRHLYLFPWSISIRWTFCEVDEDGVAITADSDTSCLLDWMIRRGHRHR